MNMQFSFSNKFQYENNLNGYTSTVSITEPQLQNIFHILDVLLCDPPNYLADFVTIRMMKYICVLQS